MSEDVKEFAKTLYIAGIIDEDGLSSVDLIEEFCCLFTEDFMAANSKPTEAEMLAEWNVRKPFFQYSPGSTDLIEVTVTARVVRKLSS